MKMLPGSWAMVDGVDSSSVYLATAKHVVFWRGLAVEVTARSFEDSATRIPATIVDTVPGLDLAVVTIPRQALARLPAMDRRGSSRDLRYNDPVTPMGCPRGSCWGVPAPPDRVVGVDPQGIIFQSIFVNPGGAELVGALKAQLALGGRMVLPAGADPAVQELIRLTRKGPEDFTVEDMADIRVAPLAAQAARLAVMQPPKAVQAIAAACEQFDAVDHDPPLLRGDSLA